MKYIVSVVCIAIFLSRVCLSQGATDHHEKPSANQGCLCVTPEVAAATLENGYAKIPFAIKNNCTQDIRVALPWDRIDGLMTVDDSGKRVFIESLESGDLPRVTPGGPIPNPVVLKPGESGTFASIYPIQTLRVVADRRKKIFGVVTGRIVTTNQSFQSYSAPFAIPSELATPPWVDLGEETYFVVTPELSESLLIGPSISDSRVIGKPQYAEVLKSGWADSVLFPVIITNTTKQAYVAATDSVRFCVVKNGSGRVAPSPWETIKTSNPILKPGESAKSTGRCYITLNYLESQGYKQGDKIVAAVGGRIPNTNQIFECYSAPFELPPLPASHPPK